MFAIDFQAPDLFESDILRERRYVLHSHEGPAGTEHISHAIQSVSGSGQRVSLRTWQSSMGGLRVSLSGADVAQFIGKAVPRGMLAEFKVGFAGFTYDEFETCGLYIFKGLSGTENNWSMDFHDLFSAFQGADSVALSAQFYKEAGTTATLQTDWATTDAEMYSLSATLPDFVKDGSSGARGLVYAQPTTGDPFYVKFTERDGVNLEVVAANVIGTTRVNMTAGDSITLMGYVSDTVPDVAHKILFGGLTGASTMPPNWHMDLKYATHNVNRPDFNRWRSKWISTYTDFEADFITDAPLENPFRGLESFLASFGSWLVIKEGGLSWRFVEQIVGGSSFSAKECAEYVITDQDIVQEDTYQLFHPDAPVEYQQVHFNGPTGGVAITEPVRTRPGLFRLDHASKSSVFDEGSSTTNRANAVLNMKHRIAPWYHRIPDQMSLTLKGWRFAELVPGDVVRLESDYIYDMINGPDLVFGASDMNRTHSGTQYLVTGVDVDWNGFTTSVQLSTPPNQA